MRASDTNRDPLLRRVPSAPVPRPTPPRPMHDIRPAARPVSGKALFPDVGMTLSSYQGGGNGNSSAGGTAAFAAAPVLPAAAARKKPAGRWRRVFTKKRIALALVLIVLGVGGWVGGKLVYNSLKVFHGSFFSILSTTKLKGEDRGRVNILLAGNSADDAGHNGANLTDSIMIISIDTKNNSAFLLSVPRDLWVSIPGYGSAKINEAYPDGQSGHFRAAGYPNGGMGLLSEVIQTNFGLPIDYYALIDYSGLRDAVNAVGGINVNIQSDDPRGLYDPSIDWSTHGPLVNLTNGEHHLNGEQALDLARARGDAYGSYGFPRSDFDRTQHQRQMLLALKSKIMSAGTLANPVALGSLFDSIGKSVHTDFTLADARRLYDIGKNIQNADIKSESLNDADGKNLLANYASPNGESALIPAAGVDDFTQIKLFVTRLTTNDPVVKEAANVVVLNGTTTDGLAAGAEATLTAKGLAVTAVGDAATRAKTTTIIDRTNGKKPATLALLKQLYGTDVTTADPYASIYQQADFIVVLGADRVPAAQ